MADRLDLIVGDFVWRKTVSINHVIGLRQMRIKRVGRVFFHVLDDCRETRYRIDTLKRAEDRGQPTVCYLTQEALKDELDRVGLFETLGKVFSPYVGGPKVFTLDQLERILAIVCEVKD